ncbi:Poly(A) polymerase [Morella rubra]|uniref:Poly(A) polymerase n=2 Tax=Morella rubra TaxID=262757 RepID=A0A6A1WHA6_9ROSI|nr:Poly(A) polymerase [Morella rubra]
MAMEANKADWDTLFEPFQFFEAYKNYLQIDVNAENADDLRKWKGWVESRLRQLTLKIERDTYKMLQCHPHPGDFSDRSRPFHCCYFMGLQRKQEVPVNEGEQVDIRLTQFDIRLTVEEFKHNVNMYSYWKPGMEIRVSHVKRRNIPNFVFPGGIRPSRPSKVSWESRRSSELKVSGHVQDNSGEGKSILNETDDERKRKRMDDSLEVNMRNTKRLATVPPSFGEVHEGSPPSNNVSPCSLKCDNMDNHRSEESRRERSANNKPDSCSQNGQDNGARCSPPIKAQSSAVVTTSSREAEKLAIEKITSGPYITHEAFPGEPDELEDDVEYRYQEKDFQGNMKVGPVESSTANAAAVPTSMQSASSGLYSNGNLEELEPTELVAPSTNVTPAPVVQPKQLIRLSFTSLAKASGKSS